MKIKRIKFLILLIALICNYSLAFTFENKIILKVDNKIITSYDLENELNYLKALNPGIENLNNNELYEISKKSVIQEKIKKIEISKNFQKAELPLEYLKKLTKNIYSKLGILDEVEFKNYLKSKEIKHSDVLKKIEIEALWNELIYIKFSDKVKIDEIKLREKIRKNINETNKSYLLSEIFYEVKQTKDINQKYKEIEKIILEKGFESAALKYSSSSTSSMGGKLDWIDSNSLNQKIKDVVKKMEINEYSEPIMVSGGFVVLQLNDVKKIEGIIKNEEKELENLINITKNNQLNQFSIIYFNKIKSDIEINEI
ncbi:peptidylprolyl isomerase [Candidatus Pelagibacter sp. HIMB1623]|uniref:peptidylprolyl isomerase n=1 Tax=unclassified Candidatus Pelagibacter TaxID=2647897 RepID=UPI003F86731F